MRVYCTIVVKTSSGKKWTKHNWPQVCEPKNRPKFMVSHVDNIQLGFTN